MKISGANDVAHPPQVVWDAILDPLVLVAAIPGCSRLESTGEHAYDMTVTAGVAAIKGTYDGSCALSDLAPHDSLTMRLTGAGAPGTVDATVAVRFEDLGGRTRIAYDADATVGGMVGGVGQRMLSSVSKRMAGEFFGNVARAIETPPALQVAEQPPRLRSSVETAGAVYAAPTVTPVAAASSPADFLRGVAVGAGLVALGVVLGGVFGRRA
ncbi:carbon monoxide dehydrogenase subunit G [Nocardioides sp. CFH 31398]|uniref:SRPBCC family protein n=1 Tax=Nocardioides sp. CFH 31398 TaxID=2919579 RepID=UPI001F05DB58|nr:carbon monoxide dehydrogenase subunit G [Nocardioides sp. CFH 31398]MCH1865924.1 carbon monoxide dehydrogenase subunit G [Nocardioides sp. CFH 31398]